MTRARLASLRLRLIIGSVFGVVAAMLLAGLFIAHLYRVHTTERFESELDHHLDELVAMTVIDAGGAPRVVQPLSDPLFNVPGSGLYWQIELADGTIIRSRSLEGSGLKADAVSDIWTEAKLNKEDLLQRSIRRTLPDGTPVLATMASARSLLEEQIRHFHADLALSISFVALLLFAGAAALVRFGFAPVQRLSDEVDRLRNGEIERLDPEVPTEFVPVVERLNALLDGQAQLIARARTESGNLAHNLRTPLALIADEAEQLRLAGNDAAADFLLTRCDAMQRQIDYHLMRAAAAGTRGAGTLTQVEPLVRQITDAMLRLHAERDIAITIEIAPEARLPCEHGDLAEILSNLIDNGCKWAERRVIVAGDSQMVEVRDDGPGIPPGQREAAIAIGTRLDPGKPGTGLGLAAAHDLLRFYDARLELETAPEGGLLARAAFSPRKGA